MLNHVFDLHVFASNHINPYFVHQSFHVSTPRRSPTCHLGAPLAPLAPLPEAALGRGTRSSGLGEPGGTTMGISGE